MKSRLLLSILSALVMISCSVGSDGTTNSPNQLSFDQTKSDFNLNQLSVPKPGISALYYVPANICPGVPIWRGAPNLPPGLDPISLPKQQCELNGNDGTTQTPTGCTVNPNNPDSLGYALSRSVVGIALPAKLDRETKNPAYWNLGCSGTIIGNKWILAAGRCFEETRPSFPKGSFKPELSLASVYVVPWQKYSYNGVSYNGVPTRFLESSGIEKYRVKTIYFSQNFDDYGANPMPALPYPSFKHEDFALLELAAPLPSNKKSQDGTNWFKPLPLRSESFTTIPPGSVWTAGYGENESQIKTGQLHYHKEMFQSQYYESNTNLAFRPSGNAQDYGQIYTMFAPTVMYNNQSSTWSFTGAGDNGGPVIYFDKDHFYHDNIESPEIIGTISSPIYCNYVGFFAPQSVTYVTNANTITYSQWIEAVINGTVPESAIRSVTPRYLHGYVYVTNPLKNKIHVFAENIEGSQLYLGSQISSVTTGQYPVTITFHPNGKYAYVVNSKDNSISMYSVLSTGVLTPLSPSQIEVGNNPVSLTLDPSGKFAYIVTQKRDGFGANLITLLNVDSDSGKLIAPPSKIIAPTENAPTSITFTPGTSFAYLTNYMSNSISMYKVNQQTGTLTTLQPYSISTESQPAEIVFDPIGQFAYVPNKLSNTISIYKKQPNGELEFQSKTMLTRESPIQIIFSPGRGDYAYVNVLDQNASGVLKFMVNHQTGELSCSDTNCPQFIQSPGKILSRFITFDVTGKFIFAISTNMNQATINWFNADPARGGGDLNAETESINYPGFVPGMITTNLVPDDSDSGSGPSSSGPSSSSGN